MKMENSSDNNNADPMDVVNSIITSHESGALHDPEKQHAVILLLVGMAYACKGKEVPEKEN